MRYYWEDYTAKRTDCIIWTKPMQQKLPISAEVAYLPAHPTKGELAAFYGYAKTCSLYTTIITKKRVKAAGLKMKFIRSKRCQRIPKPLADIIYREEGITSLRKA